MALKPTLHEFELKSKPTTRTFRAHLRNNGLCNINPTGSKFSYTIAEVGSLFIQFSKRSLQVLCMLQVLRHSNLIRDVIQSVTLALRKGGHTGSSYFH